MKPILSAPGATCLAIGLAVLVPRIHAQAPAVDPSATFEVASVKANRSGDNRTMIGGQPGGRFNVTNAALRQIILIAYQIQPFQLIGGPGWIGDERFDIVAKAPANTPLIGPPGSGSPGPMQVMMRNLLADRFKLKVHTESREMPIYALVLARSDGKLGSKITPTSVDCAALRGRGPGGPPPAPPGPGERPRCGMMMGIGSLAAGGVSMTQLAATLSQRVGRTVIDKTGLSGSYEFNLDFTPDQMPPAAGPGATPPPGAPPLPPVDPNGPSIYTALQEQLGLKLDSQRGPVDVIVIDSVDRPTED
jgi:bla regulator protein blaR1